MLAYVAACSYRRRQALTPPPLGMSDSTRRHIAVLVLVTDERCQSRTKKCPGKGFHEALLEPTAAVKCNACIGYGKRGADLAACPSAGHQNSQDDGILVFVCRSRGLASVTWRTVCEGMSGWTVSRVGFRISVAYASRDTNYKLWMHLCIVVVSLRLNNLLVSKLWVWRCFEIVSMAAIYGWMCEFRHLSLYVNIGYLS